MVHKNLKSNGIDVGMIHGKMNQNKRIKSINQFNNGKQKILVASPVAARGLDIKNVSHIFNYDLSDDPQEYVHRVGRTARGGKKGKAYTLLSRRDRHVFNRILTNYDLEIEKLPLEEFPIIPFKTRNKKFSSDNKKFKTRNKKFKTRNKKSKN
jgi:superfamily II DNA/RNA helicase